ncbi:MAG: PqqD family protein [Eubacterium sp.]
MKIKEGFVLRKMSGKAVVVSVGSASEIFNGMIKLNETGEFLWQQMEDNASESDLVQALLEKYDVSEEIAQNDVKTFIDTLKEPGIIE